MKPLDFVRTPKGAIALIKEVNYSNKKGESPICSIEFLGRLSDTAERNAWWDEEELEVIDNLPSLLARTMAHPFGEGEDAALDIYPINQSF